MSNVPCDSHSGEYKVIWKRISLAIYIKSLQAFFLRIPSTKFFLITMCKTEDITFFVPQHWNSVCLEEAFVCKDRSWIIKIRMFEQSHIWWCSLNQKHSENKIWSTKIPSIKEVINQKNSLRWWSSLFLWYYLNFQEVSGKMKGEYGNLSDLT